MAGQAGGWFVSSFSNAQSACVEVRFHGPRVEIRDTKDRTGPVLSVTRAEWTAFLTGSGTTPLAAEPTTDGGAVLHTGGPDRLHFTPAEWTAYRLGVEAGEFDPPHTAVV